MMDLTWMYQRILRDTVLLEEGQTTFGLNLYMIALSFSGEITHAIVSNADPSL